MNNKGQALVIFLILLPILLGLCALVIDSAYIVANKNKLTNINEIAIRDTLDGKSKKEVEEEIKINDKNIEIMSFKKEDNKVSIHLQNNIKSIFGSIIGYEKYEINSKLTGKIVDNKKIISEG